MRVKNREVDILIVVNMFVAGFDATTLNTLLAERDLQDYQSLYIDLYQDSRRVEKAIRKI